MSRVDQDQGRNIPHWIVGVKRATELQESLKLIILFLYAFQNAACKFGISSIRRLSLSRCDISQVSSGYHPLIKHTVNDAVMQTWLGERTLLDTGRQTITSGEAQAVRQGLKGRPCKRCWFCVFVCISVFLPILQLTHTNTSSPQGAVKQGPAIYQLSASKPLIQQAVFVPKCM